MRKAGRRRETCFVREWPGQAWKGEREKRANIPPVCLEEVLPGGGRGPYEGPEEERRELLLKEETRLAQVWSKRRSGKVSEGEVWNVIGELK